MEHTKFSVLIVEDHWPIVKQLLDIFRTYDDWRIESALCITEARLKIKEALEEGHPYDAYTLDIELPDSVGAGATITFELHQYIRKQSPEALIAYCSANLDHVVVKRQLQHPDSQTLIFKKENAWIGDVVEALHQRLHGDPVRRELIELFDAPMAMASGRGRVVTGAAGYNLTRKMSALVSRVVDSWRYLDDDLKHDIGSYFKTEEKDGAVTLSLY